MPGTNGHAASVLDILDLSDLAVKRTTIKVTRNDELVALDAYVYGDNTFGTLKAELAEIRDAFLDVTKDPGANDTQKNSAYIAYLRESLRKLVPDMTFAEADALSGHESRAIAVLQELAYFQTADPEAAPEVASDTPLTMAASSPTSPSTRTRTRKSR